MKRTDLQTCVSCGQEKPLYGFPKIKGQWLSRCTMCSVKEIETENRSINQMRKYKIPQELFVAILQAQHGRCAICHKVCPNQLCVDHDHRTGKVRGLLCPKCNAAIGLMRDDPNLLYRAARYLKLAGRKPDGPDLVRYIANGMIEEIDGAIGGV